MNRGCGVIATPQTGFFKLLHVASAVRYFSIVLQIICLFGQNGAMNLMNNGWIFADVAGIPNL